MGKGVLGDFIRKTDYLKAKKNYEDSADNPCNQLNDVQRKCNDTLEELKDGFAAFEQKVCVRNFPGRRSPAGDVANSTMRILLDQASTVMDDEKLISPVCALIMHALTALMSAGPTYTQCELMGKIMDCRSPKIKEYAETLGQKELVPIMLATKVKLEYIPDPECEESTYASYLHNKLEQFFLLFSYVYDKVRSEQYKLVQQEFLDAYIHYQAQLPLLSEAFSLQVYYTLRGMVGNFEGKNPYLNLKNAEIMKKHLRVLQDNACSNKFAKKNGLDSATEAMSKFILQAAISDGIVEQIFDDVMLVTLAMHKNDNARCEGGNIFHKIKVDLFSKLSKSKTPVTKILKSCSNMVVSVLSHKDLVPESLSMLEEATAAVISKAKGVEETKLSLAAVNAIVQSGRSGLIKKGKDALDTLKKGKVLDWKNHLEEARQILSSMGKIPKEDFQDDKESWLHRTVSAYKDFIKLLLDQFKKNKVLPQLQSSLVDCFFDCLVVDSPSKGDFAREIARKDYLDFSKEVKLRQVVLEKCEGLIKKKDLPWEDMDLTVPFVDILVIVIDSYDENGKNVTTEENALFMSIFKTVSEEDDSIEDHFYIAESDDSPNVNLRIWRQVLRSYISLHQETATVACVAPMMTHLLRWAKIALAEEHDDLTDLTFRMISTMGRAVPKAFKTDLPQIVDLMLETDKCDDLASLVESIYPYNVNAVHNRLQDMFDKMDDLTDKLQSVFIVLFYFVSRAHPEVFTKTQISTLFDWYSQWDNDKNVMVLMILAAIAEKHPPTLKDFFPQLCDDKLFKPESLITRSNIITCVGSLNETLGEKAVDYLMKYINYSDLNTSRMVLGSICSMLRKHKDYMLKYKDKFEKLEQTSTVPQVKDTAHDIILVLEGKSAENIFEDIQARLDDLAGLEEKVDATIGTVIALGDTVVKHDKEIAELGEGLDQLEERVEDVEEDVEEAKIKIEEVDNKTMSNAPKWSRDLTKLMNPTTENDWRLLASRLGYTNDDIRGWATQHDPCMALLSEWYATHKTSEASFGVLTALTEMNRMDGAAIVENAMKTAEGVVEDEEFEYPSPPPVFISYQWGVQDEVKLLKQHLNMAGFECWLDVGQMGGGDKLFAKIDNGIRAAKVVICCVTEKYAKSPNCNREVNLSVNLNKPVIPLLMEKMDWPPRGSMGPIFSEYLFIRFFQRQSEETEKSDQRYWPIPKFTELLMQLNFYVVPDAKMIQKEYANWWTPMTEDIKIDKSKGRKESSSQKPQESRSEVVKADENPLVFLSYQWGRQPQVKALYQRLTSMGYTVWMDIYQMGGGDSLYDKIDRGMRGCKAVVSCVTQKYSLSANCRREVSLADALKKPMIPLLLEQIKWPPDGPMSMVFTELLYINFYRDEAVQMTWKCAEYDELISKLGQYVPVTEVNAVGKIAKSDSQEKGERKTQNSTENGKSSQAIVPAGNQKTINSNKTSKLATAKGTAVSSTTIGDKKKDAKATNEPTKSASKTQTSTKALPKNEPSHKVESTKKPASAISSDSRRPMTNQGSANTSRSVNDERKEHDEQNESNMGRKENHTNKMTPKWIDNSENSQYTNTKVKPAATAVNAFKTKSDKSQTNAINSNSDKLHPAKWNASSKTSGAVETSKMTKMDKNETSPPKSTTVSKQPNPAETKTVKPLAASNKQQFKQGKVGDQGTGSKGNTQKADAAKEKTEQGQGSNNKNANGTKSKSCIII